MNTFFALTEMGADDDLYLVIASSTTFKVIEEAMIWCKGCMPSCVLQVYNVCADKVIKLAGNKRDIEARGMWLRLPVLLLQCFRLVSMRITGWHLCLRQSLFAEVASADVTGQKRCLDMAYM